MSEPRPNRRRMLAAGAALLVAGPVALAGCTGFLAAPETPDPLESPARRAETDSALAQVVAQMAAQLAGPAQPQTHAALATAASALAADRTAHASTLRAELRRVRPAPAPSSAARPAVPTPAPPLAAPDLASARAALLQAMHAAHDEAAGLVMALPGYRAALLASIAACCVTHAVLLP
ncbi:MAG: hypothetical protein ACRDTH_15235 [Pseudonocardiaceae bacterium]